MNMAIRYTPKRLLTVLIGLIFILSMAFMVYPEDIYGASPTWDPGPGATDDGPPDFVDVLIGFDRTPGPAERSLVVRSGGSIKYSYTLVPAIAASVPSKALQGLQRDPRVAVIEPDGMAWAIDYAAELDNSWGVKHILAGEVHKTGNLAAGVKVAVLDTGIAQHADLGIAGGVNFTSGDGKDYYDRHGHGTHVAGTIAAIRNGAGVVGVSPAIELYSVKVLGDDGGGKYSDIIAGIQWSVDNKIQVTNNSYGSSGDPGTIIKKAFDDAYAAGILHVGAAGNSGNQSGNGDNVIYPARWDSVIAVAAISQSNKRANFSSTGPDLELSAPGVEINSTWLNGAYRKASGTSMASPHVAGTAALVIAGGVSSNTEVRQVLRDTADNLGNPNHYGYGLINSAAAADAGGSENASVALSPTSHSAMAWPGETASYEFKIENTGDVEDTYTISTDSSWGSSPSETALKLNPGDWVAVTVTHTVPQDALVGDFNEGTISAVSGITGASAIARFSTAARGHSVEIFPATQTGSGVPGGQVEYVYTISNTGTEDDIYLLETNALWDTSISHTSIAVAAGRTASITVTHIIPQDAHTGDYDAATVAVDSSSMEGVNTTAAFTTTVLDAPADATMTVSPIVWWTIGGNKHLKVELTIVDSGGAAVSGAAVIATLTNESRTWNFTGTTSNDGKISFGLNHAPSGNYSLVIDEVKHGSLAWDERQPDNNTFTKK
jgi:subtilisin family serine protease